MKCAVLNLTHASTEGREGNEVSSAEGGTQAAAVAAA